MTPEREMEIRAYYAHEGEPPVSFYRPKEAGSAARYDMAEVLAALDAEREKAARLERERDTLAAKLDEREGDMHARIRAEYDRTIADTWRAANARMADERDALAAQLAALHAKARAYREVAEVPPGNVDTVQDVARDDLDTALADTAPAAEAYTRRVQAEALVTAAKTCEREADDCSTATGSYIASRCGTLLRASAAEIRGGDHG